MRVEVGGEVLFDGVRGFCASQYAPDCHLRTRHGCLRCLFQGGVGPSDWYGVEAGS